MAEVVKEGYLKGEAVVWSQGCCQTNPFTSSRVTVVVTITANGDEIFPQVKGTRKK